MSRREENPSAEKLINLFSRAYSAVVDSCSLILMQKGGYWQLALSSLSLLVPCPVCRETSMRNCLHGNTADADDEILRIAAERGYAIVSDDKQVLMRSRKLEIPHLNSLTTLLCLLYNRRINEKQYYEYLSRLREEARYAEWIWDYGDRALSIILRIK